MCSFACFLFLRVLMTWILEIPYLDKRKIFIELLCLYQDKFGCTWLRTSNNNGLIDVEIDFSLTEKKAEISSQVMIWCPNWFIQFLFIILLRYLPCLLFHNPRPLLKVLLPCLISERMEKWEKGHSPVRVLLEFLPITCSYIPLNRVSAGEMLLFILGSHKPRLK